MRITSLLLLLLAAWPAVAQRTPAAPAAPRGAIPTADAPGLRDSAALPRYAGALLLAGNISAFDEVSLPNAPLERLEGARDMRNNIRFVSPAPLRLEGRRSRLTYLIPEGRSPLEVIRGYQQVVTGAGGETVFECAAEACGGSATMTGSGAGGSQAGMLQALLPYDEVPTDAGRGANCALDEARANQRYALVSLPNNAGHAAILAWQVGAVSAGSECRLWVGRTVALLLVLETAAREQRMEIVTAQGMGAALEREGRVALYAILFDTGRAELKPESGPQLAAMADLLRANPGLRVLIVGHTDNQGALELNMDLSRRRAASVVQALTGRGIAASRMVPQGVGMAAPLATNDTDEGRTRNRRVELVKQ